MILRAGWLLVRLRTRRLLNMWSSGLRWGGAFRGGGAAGSVGGGGGSAGAGSGGDGAARPWGRRIQRRVATAPKRRTGFFAVPWALMMLAYAVFFAVTSTRNVERTLGGAATTVHGIAAAPWGGGAELSLSEPAIEMGLVLVLSLLVLTSFLSSVGARELAAPEWDMEWLVTLPVPLSTLLGMRILERTLLCPIGWIALWPFLSVLAWHGGAGWSSPIAGLLAAVPLLVLIGALRVVVDTGLRLVFGPARLRNVQAIVAILGLVTLYLAFSVGMPTNDFVLRWARHLPAGARFLPGGQAIRALMDPEAGGRWQAAALLLAEVTALVAGLLLLVRWWLRAGVVATGSRESGGRRARATRLAAARASTVAPAPGPAAAPAGALAGALVAERAAAWPRRALLTPIQARELRLLSRDRNFLVQTMVLPIVIMGAQLLFNPTLLHSLGHEPAHLGALVFGLAAYTLMFSAFQTLNAEGQALWVLWSVPHPLETLLRQKARLWSVLTLVYPVVLLSLGAGLGSGLTGEALVTDAIVLAGVPIFATIATCLGVFGCDPLAQEVQRKVRPTYAYLFFFIASAYTYAIYASTAWQKLGCVTLTALLSIALWQKARDRLPYLLDPTAMPPARVSVADGMIAALAFFVLQGVIGLMLLDSWSEAPGFVLLLSFTLAGVLTVVTMRLIQARTGALGVPRFLGGRNGRAVALGVLAGVVAGALGVLYMLAVRSTGAFHDEILLAQKARRLVGHDITGWIFVLAVFAAPPCEEFIFRGLVFGGLRRSMRLLPAALASAAIFAVVHPPVSVAPVFCLALCAAFVYERTGTLLAPLLAHSVYNLIAFLGQQVVWT